MERAPWPCACRTGRPETGRASTVAAAWARRSCLMRFESPSVARALHQVSMYQSRESMEWFTKETPYARGNHP
jgi:hypothetical protein